MELYIDGCQITPRPEESLVSAIRNLGLDTALLSTRPLAAKIAGEVFNLNYIPIRQKDTSPDRPTIRRAMAASGGVVHLLRITDPTGRDVSVSYTHLTLPTKA